MERLYRMRWKVHAGFVDGNCEICRQTSVKVKPLQCKKHSYCRVCAEFDPHLRSGDIKCKTCVSMRDVEKQQRVEEFIKQQTGIEHFQEIFKGREEEVSTPCIGHDQDDDLTGNNSEWEHLLQPSNDVNPGPSHSEQPRHQSMSRALAQHPDPRRSPSPPRPIPRKNSIMSLVNPSAESKYNGGVKFPCSSKQPISNTVTGLLQGSEFAPRAHCISLEQSVSVSSMCGSVASSRSSGSWKDPHMLLPSCQSLMDHRSCSVDSFRADSAEIERGSSPCKAPQRRDISWSVRGRSGNSDDDDDESEIELMKDYLGDIEGPVTCSPESETSLWSSLQPQNTQEDLFWDG